MTKDAPPSAWVPTVETADGPLYMAISEAIARDIRAGTLRPGQRLPPQRSLAETLGVDFSTVSRAYAVAIREGLVEGRVGQGTFVRDAATDPPEVPRRDKDQRVDMTMNMPPRFDDPAIAREMRESLAQWQSEESLDVLMRYQSPGGSATDRQAAQSWLSGQFALQGLEDLVICSGVQGAALAALSQVAKPGDAVCCEALSYPGFLTIARHMGLTVLPVAMDADGLDPAALDAICAQASPKALYVTPTLHNPTTITMPEARRQDIARVARKYGVLVVEDDAYGAVATDAPPPIATYAPERTCYLASLSKCLAPSLRVCLAVPPVGMTSEGFKRTLRATGNLVSPLSALTATRWIRSGLAGRITTAIRTETAQRQAIFAKWLPDVGLTPNAFHVWLPLPDEVRATDLVLGLRIADLGLVPGQAFSAGAGPNAVRVALGSSDSRASYQAALRSLRDALENPQHSDWMVV